jgi:AmmeMemoRadiSam system protein B
MLLSPPAYRLTQLMNGLLERPDILRLAAERLGIQLSLQQLGELINALDEYRLLDNATTRGYLDQLPARPPAHAGSAYPKEPEQLQHFLDDLLDEPLLSPLYPSRAYLIPHIDLQRGKESYAQAWNHLRHQLQEFDTFIILGISHAYSAHPFVLTRKHFDTPLGRVETDLTLVEELARRSPFDPFADEFNHLGEHSVEFQAIFLQHLCQRPFRIVPILCGSFHECLTTPSWPEEDLEVAGFLQAVESLLAPRERTCWIASVDLAHMGQRFGGPRLSPNDLEFLQRRDLATMERAVQADPQGFLQSLQEDRGERNYCGTSAIYSMLRVLKPKSGRLLHYQQCNEPGLTSTVTVASASYPC